MIARDNERTIRAALESIRPLAVGTMEMSRQGSDLVRRFVRDRSLAGAACAST